MYDLTQRKRSRQVPIFNYSTWLRCIGEDLEQRGLKTLDLRNEGQKYVVLCGYQSPPAPTPVTLHYSQSDIQQLDKAGREKRGKPAPPKEFVTLVQILRAIGGYLDKIDAHLVRISNNAAPSKDWMFRVEYVDRDGERVVDDRAGSALYDICVSMYKQRRRMTGTGGK